MGRHGSRPAATHEQTLSPLREQCGLWAAVVGGLSSPSHGGAPRRALAADPAGAAVCEPDLPAVSPRLTPEEGAAGRCRTASSAWTSSPGRAAALRRAPQRARDPPGAACARGGHRRAQRDRAAAPLRGAGGAAAGRPGAAARATGGAGRVILALDGLQPDVGHEVLWVLRDCLSGEVLLARSLLGATADELVPLLASARRPSPASERRTIPIRGVISDGQESIRNAVARALPGVPHQLCQFHYLREAAKPIFEADRHAKKELKKRVRGVRPIERALEGRDGRRGGGGARLLPGRPQRADRRRPPAAGRLRPQAQERLDAIAASLDRVEHAQHAKRQTRQPTATRGG